MVCVAMSVGMLGKRVQCKPFLRFLSGGRQADMGRQLVNGGADGTG